MTRQNGKGDPSLEAQNSFKMDEEDEARLIS